MRMQRLCTFIYPTLLDCPAEYYISREEAVGERTKQTRSDVSAIKVLLTGQLAEKNAKIEEQAATITRWVVPAPAATSWWLQAGCWDQGHARWLCGAMHSR